MGELRSVVLGVGAYLPERVVENAEFEKTLETNDAWIRSRSGIERRHFAAEGQLTSDLALNACKACLENAGVDASTVDAVILATSTPDQTFPSTATKVQAALGMTHGFAFDVQAVCAGFPYALTTADAMIRTGQAKRALVIGAETFSRIMNWKDRSTCVLFGDGAGALLIEGQEDAERGVLSCALHSDGRYNEILYVDGGVSSTQTTGVLVMEGKEVFKHAVAKMSDNGFEALEMAGLTAADVTWCVPHQANLRIIKAVSQKMGVPMERFVQTVQDHGNTSAASIPLALDAANRAGKLNPGDIILSGAIGGGLAWGAAVIRW